MADTIRRVLLVNEYRTTGLASGTRQLNQLGVATTAVSKKQKTLFSRMTKARIAFFNFAVIAGTLAIAFRSIISPAIELESEMANVRKTTGASKDSIEELRQELIGISKVLPITAIELAKIAAVAGQAGIRGTKSITSFTNTIAMMAIATDLSAEEAAKALVKVSNAFNIPISQANKLGSVINELSNTTAATAAEIVSSLTRVGAAGGNLGLTAEFVAALGATLIDAGFRAERAGTRMRSALRGISRNIEELAKLTKIPLEQFRKQLDVDPEGTLLKVLQSLKDAGATTAEIAKIFGAVGGFAIETFVANLDDVNKNLATARLEMKDGLSLLKETGLFLDTTANKWKIIGNNIRAATLDSQGFLSTLGTTLLTDIISKRLEEGVQGVQIASGGVLGLGRDPRIKGFETSQERVALGLEDLKQKYLDIVGPGIAYNRILDSLAESGDNVGIKFLIVEAAIKNQKAAMRSSITDLEELNEKVNKEGDEFLLTAAMIAIYRAELEAFRILSPETIAQIEAQTEALKEQKGEQRESVFTFTSSRDALDQYRSKLAEVDGATQDLDTTNQDSIETFTKLREEQETLIEELLVKYPELADVIGIVADEYKQIGIEAEKAAKEIEDLNEKMSAAEKIAARVGITLGQQAEIETIAKFRKGVAFRLPTSVIQNEEIKRKVQLERGELIEISGGSSSSNVNNITIVESANPEQTAEVIFRKDKSLAGGMTKS